MLVNFTPGSGSHRDWSPEGHAAFEPSEQILADILAHEAKEPDGLNGHLLLMHLGSQRQDKFPAHLGLLIDELAKRGYQLVRVDELLGAGDLSDLSLPDGSTVPREEYDSPKTND